MRCIWNPLLQLISTAIESGAKAAVEQGENEVREIMMIKQAF